MDYKKNNAPTTVITRDCGELESKTGNLYETVVVASRRANQIGADLKNELNNLVGTNEVTVTITQQGN